MARSLYSSLEPLEARIAPASLTVFHPLVDITPSAGQTASVIDLGASFDQDPTAGYRTHIVFTTNYDIDPVTPGLQPGKIVLELFDEKAPLTVQNFLTYMGQGTNGHSGYVGTYFHRIQSVAEGDGIDILQGGGYKASAPTTAITTGPTVHNEYDPNDSERQNTEGTIAMAKGSDPNSGANEFFFNLADNSQQLNGSNTGGFTVFGKIVSGLDVAKAIAGLPLIPLTNPNDHSPGVVHTPTAPVAGNSPYQNGYQLDPDGNSATASPTPTVNQLVDITGAQVVPPKNSTIAGVRYGVVSILDESTGLASRLVTGTVSGDNLVLRYLPGATGIMDVSVLAKDASGNSVTQSFHVNLTPNLISGGVIDTFQTNLQVGDTATETVKLVNTGAGTSHGTVTVNYFLSRVTAASGNDPSGVFLDGSDVPVGSFSAPYSVASTKTALVSGSITIPEAARQNLADGVYRLIGRISTSGDAITSDIYGDDNLVVAGYHQYISAPRDSDLAVGNVTDNLPRILVPGDTGLAQATLANISQKTALGKVDVNFYVTNDTTLTDTLVGSLSGVSLNLAGGKGINVVAPVAIPPTLDLTEGSYHLHAVATPAATGGAGDLRADNDSAYTSFNHVLVDEFGTIQINGITRSAAVLKYEDSAGQLVSLRLAGPGIGRVLADSDGGVSWYVDSNSSATTFGMALTTAAGTALPATTHTVVNNLVVSPGLNASIGSVILPQVDFVNSVNLLGGVGRLTLGNTSGDGDHFINLNAPVTGTALRSVIVLGTLQDTSFSSENSIASLTTGSWLSVNGDTQTVSAPAIDAFTVKGDFTADLTITPAAVTTAQVLKTFTVSGALSGSTVRIGGNVGTVQLGALLNSDFLVGADYLPQALHDFNGAYTLGSFRVTGLPGGGSAVVNSNVAADRITGIAFASVQTLNDLHPFGIVSEKIAAYQIGTTPYRNLDATHGVPATDDYTVILLGA